jgi:hypothetical protein
LGWSLARVATTEPEDLLEERGIALPAALAKAQVVLDHAPNDGLVELIGDFRPSCVGLGMGEGVAAALGKGGEGSVAGISVGRGVHLETAPEFRVEQRLQPVRDHQWLDRGTFPESYDLAQEQRSKLQGGDAPGEAVTTRFDAQRGAAGHDDAHRAVVDQRLDLGSPVREVLDLVEE